MSPRIALVHGIGRDLHDWDAVLPGLADIVEDRAGDLVPVDLAGFGDAPPPPDGRYSPAAHAERVARQVLEDAHGPVHLVGNSLGGLVATLVAAREPTRVASLTLVAPALPVGRTSSAGVQLSLLGLPAAGPALIRAGRRQPADRRARDLATLTLSRPREFDPDRLVALEQAILARDAVPHADPAFAATMRGISALLLRPWPVRRAIAGLRMPVVALYGRYDRLVPVRQAAQLQRLLPSADVRVLPHAGHLIPLEDPADVVDAVRSQVALASVRRP